MTTGKRCHQCGRLNFADTAQCYSCEAQLIELEPRASDERDEAFRRQSASFGDDWSGASAPRDEPTAHAARSTTLSDLMSDYGRVSLGEQALGILVFGVFALMLFAEECGEEESGGATYYVGGSGGSGGYAPSVGKSSRMGSTGSRWSSSGGSGFGK